MFVRLKTWLFVTSSHFTLIFAIHFALMQL